MLIEKTGKVLGFCFSYYKHETKSSLTLLEEASVTSTYPLGALAKRERRRKSLFPPGCVCWMLTGNSNLLPPRRTAAGFTFYPRSTHTWHLGRQQLRARRSERFSSSIFPVTSLKRSPAPRLPTGNAIMGPNETSPSKTIPSAAGEPRGKPSGRAKVTDSQPEPTPSHTGPGPASQGCGGRPSGPGTLSPRLLTATRTRV